MDKTQRQSIARFLRRLAAEIETDACRPTHLNMNQDIAPAPDMGAHDLFLRQRRTGTRSIDLSLEWEDKALKEKFFTGLTEEV